MKNQQINDITFIYYLHKGDNIPFYVGKTVNPNSRKAEHGYKSKGGCKPGFVIIDEVPTDEWLFWEKYWISQFKCWGFILENRNKGGGGPIFRTEESLKKQSQSLMGHVISEETKEKMRKSALGRHHTSKQSKTLSDSLKQYYAKNKGPFHGKTHTQESRDKLSKPVLAFDENNILVGEYPSLKDAGVAHNIHSGNIIRSMKRNGKCRGLFWSYKK
jgi:hypothetical protein